MIYQNFFGAACLRHTLGTEHGLMHRIRRCCTDQHHIGSGGQIGGGGGGKHSMGGGGGNFLRLQVIADHRIAQVAQALGEGKPHQPEADETDDQFVLAHGNSANAAS